MYTYLFDNGLKDIDRMNKFNTNPIQIACARNNTAALKFLLDKKANIDVKVERYLFRKGDKEGDSYYEGDGDNLLHICVRRALDCATFDCLLILLPFCEHLIDVQNFLGQTPRQIAPHIWDNAINGCNAKASEAKRVADEEA
jgi:ankyrin repeat protein